MQIINSLSQKSYELRIAATGKTETELAQLSDDELLQFASIGRKTLYMLRGNLAKKCN